jgi:hypothetical protein
MLPWLDRVDEIIVVDSNSTDGTVNIITNRISHPNLQIHQRPRGLYQAWNYGIQQVQSKYTYISTVGDSITAHGIDHLLKVATTNDSDVVVSSPEFINEEGSRPRNPPIFAIDNLLKKLKNTEPRQLNNMECIDFIVSSFPNAILGSSASNLYRTEVMKRYPFPTSYGTAGDGAWGMAHGLCHHIAVTPEKFSTFRVHGKAYSKSDYVVDDLNDQLLNLLEEGVRQWISENENMITTATLLMMREVLDLLKSSFISQKDLEEKRRQSWPWALNPWAWNARFQRAKIRRRIETLTNSLLAV